MEEPILSEELRQELGNHANIVVLSKRKRRKGENEVGNVALPDEEIHSIKKQSKRQKKRFEQSQNKKMRASKQGDYISAIKLHEISPQHRELLASSTSLNQTKSLKQTLTALLKKERAGIPLTDEERAVLYKTCDIDANDESEVFSSSLKSSIELRDMNNTTTSASNKSLESEINGENNVDSGLLFSFDTITASSSNKRSTADTTIQAIISEEEPVGGGKANQKDKKKSKKKRTREIEDEAAVIVPEEKPMSLGQRMLQQFGKLKDKPFAQKAEIVEEEKHPISCSFLEETVDIETAQEPTHHAPKKNDDTAGNVKTISNVHSIIKEESSASQDSEFKKQKIGSSKATASATTAATAPVIAAVHVTVHRPADIEASRMQLPVSQMEQEIIEAINANDTIILCGETGSGKSTQLPIFLYEAGYAMNDQMIGIAQPRRVAVISTAERVHYEMGSVSYPQKHHSHRLVGYQIRHESLTVGPQTAIKFMTDGILLREISDDILLRKYRVIILDEAHERNVNTDILLGLLSRSVPLRKRISWEENAKYRSLSAEDRLTSPLPIQPLKLIIMSATLRTEDFLQPQLFPSKLPPIIKVESRTFPITVHFNKRTELNHQAKGANGYLEQCYRKILAMHRKLPPGGILVFVTGKREILSLCRRVKRALLPKQKNVKEEVDEEEYDSEEGDDLDEHDSDSDIGEDDQVESNSEEEDDENDRMQQPQPDDDDDDVVQDDEDEEGDSSGIRQRMLAQLLGRPLASVDTQQTNTEEKKQDDNDQRDEQSKEEQLKLIPVIHPLFAMMPAAAQARIFQPLPSPNHRLIVIATNVAETSITIPGIRYVLDSGRCKQRVSTTSRTNDKDGNKSGVGSRYEVQWISQAAAEQRAGRAGRTGPGHVYRLYSAQFYHEHMSKFMPPEITRTPCEEVLLHMMALGIEKVDVFPFPTPPPPRLVHQAMTLLTNLGAISTRKMEVNGLGKQLGRLSPLGQWLRLFPLHPRFGKMIVVAITLTKSMQSHEQRQRLLGHVLTMVATLAERSVFELDGRLENGDDDDEEERDQQQDEEDGEEKAKAKHPPLWHHSSGDAMARLRATGAYLHCLSSSVSSSSMNANFNSKAAANITTAGFCRMQSLHEPTLLRIIDLRKQLQHITQASVPKITGNNSHNSTSNGPLLSLESPSTPPTAAEEQALRQILLAGYCDSIARKAPLGSVQGPGQNRRRRLTAYLSGDPAVTTPIYIHPTSNVYKSDPTVNLPEFVCYGSLIRNQRGDALFMTAVTALQPQWVAPVCLQYACPLLSLSSPLATPVPYYDHDHEQCMVYVTPSYGSQKWTLPGMSITAEQAVNSMSSSGGMTSAPQGYRPQDLQYKLFARFLLTGMLKLSCRQLLTSKALKEPNAIMQTKIHPKIAMLLQQLVDKDVKNRLNLVSALSRQPRFLLTEIEALVLPEVKERLRQVWSTLTIEV